MRLVHLLPSTFYGAPEKQIRMMARETRARYGHEHSFLVMPQRGHRLDDNEFVQLLRVDGFSVREFATRVHYDLLGANRKLRAELALAAPDVLLSYGYKADIVAAGLPRTVRKVAVLHGWTASHRRVRVFEAVNRVALRFFSTLVVVSRAQVASLRAHGFPQEKIVCILNALDPASLPEPLPHEELKRRLNIPTGARVIGSVGRLSSEKGHADLLHAMRRVAAAAPDVHLVLVGDGPEEGSLRELARTPSLEGRVHFAGFQKDGASWVGALELLVLPSHRETLPVVILEAFAHGVPVVGTCVGDVADLVRDGETGWTAAPRRPEQLADRILEALGAPEEAREAATRAARELLQQEHVPARQAEQWQALLTSL